jgi:hypothetical protein
MLNNNRRDRTTDATLDVRIETSFSGEGGPRAFQGIGAVAVEAIRRLSHSSLSTSIIPRRFVPVNDRSCLLRSPCKSAIMASTQGRIDKERSQWNASTMRRTYRTAPAHTSPARERDIVASASPITVE